ncbi:hypothetical protein [Roseateles sp.]|uniref:hypothetical protein n=1 Tax=Roseateles sp. TaxID=1971397 RepID=UPI003265BEAF
MTTATSVEKNQRATGITVAAGLLLLVFGFSAVLSLSSHTERSNPIWFIGMLIIFASSLALIAVVFRWLGLAAPAEAFGLPAGSIRTLLAAGVMVLFAVFGLQTLSVNAGLAEKSLGNAAFVGTAAELQAEVERYRQLGLAAVVESIDNGSAKLKLYRITPPKPLETIDMEKQIITALVTLVTSVVSFYFGSRTAEASRDGPGAAKLPESTTEEVKRIDTTLDELRKRITALHADEATPGNEATLASSLSQADAGLKAAEESRAKLAASIKDLGSGGNSAETASTAAARLTASLVTLTQAVAQAEALVAKG